MSTTKTTNALFLLVTMAASCMVIRSMKADEAVDGVSETTGRPIIIAHRGASGYLPEHTEGSKVLAIAQGADYIEQDVVLTRDDVPVVLHDIHLDNVTNVGEVFPDRSRKDGRYYAIDFDWSEIQKLSVKERVGRDGKNQYSSRFPGSFGQKIMRLEDEIILLQGINQTLGKNVGLYVELKSPSFHQTEKGEPMGEKVLAVLQKYGYDSAESRCYVQCFEADELKRLKTKGCQLKLIQLLGGLKDGSDFAQEMKAIAEYATGVGPSITALVQWSGGSSIPTSNGLVEAAHAAGLKIHPYTVRVDQLPPWSKDIDALHGVLFNILRVDGVFTDFPDLGRKAVDK
ncbi:MAG: Glycerophosphoryl diester phosphodiesterase precursor [Planctomycetota bacterium]